ncbi:hypothetical protein EUAN_08760 [Andreesenia angusta]|uniref:RNA polymerase sigma-70 region 4 domain-containing protein n=1 Tax=Andreesenia angusta TaxID=39480 RepID=A0A1S1V916_9FIRM|nr:hypothetical protein [Andreesenia angusta]OHW63092.1 hypothetical protein EUAN_08760 [Andreesenia angusta]
MVAIKIAKDLDVEKDVIEMEIERLKRQYYALEKIRDTHKMDVATYHDQLFRTERAIENYQGMLEDLVATRYDIGNKLKDLKGLEYKVGRMKLLEGKKLEEIADELGYSYDHIARISSKIKLR